MAALGDEFRSTRRTRSGHWPIALEAATVHCTPTSDRGRGGVVAPPPPSRSGGLEAHERDASQAQRDSAAGGETGEVLSNRPSVALPSYFSGLTTTSQSTSGMAPAANMANSAPLFVRARPAWTRPAQPGDADPHAAVRHAGDRPARRRRGPDAQGRGRRRAQRRRVHARDLARTAQGEVLGLSWADVYLELVRLRVRQQLERRGYCHGCEDPTGCDDRPSECRNRRDGGLVPAESETRQSKRTLPMPQPMMGALGRHRQDQRKARMYAGSEWLDSGLVSPLSPAARSTMRPLRAPGKAPRGCRRPAGTAARRQSHDGDVPLSRLFMPTRPGTRTVFAGLLSAIIWAR